MFTATGHEIGKTYSSHYWGKTYTVVGTVETRLGQYVVVNWSDGTSTTHCTARGTDALVSL